MKDEKKVLERNDSTCQSTVELVLNILPKVYFLLFFPSKLFLLTLLIYLAKEPYKYLMQKKH